MKHNSGEACKCDLCATSKPKPGPKIQAKRPLTAASHQNRPPPLNRGPVDEEGTPDVYCSLFTLLKHEGSLSRTIEERASLDWRAERPLVDTLSKSTPRQPAFIPRHGEIVLYLRPLPASIQLQQGPKTQQIFLYDTQKNRSAGSPKWLAGVVTQVPSTHLNTASLYPPPSKSAVKANHETEEPSLSLSGFRIEPLPSPNSSDKHISKQHTYTPLHFIRPFAFWQLLLMGIPESEWHVSIHNALTASATVSLIDRERLNGCWPNASIYSRGLFVGAECYWIGDTIRLLFEPPAATPKPNDALYKNTLIVMKIHHIITTFHNLHPEPTNHDLVTGNRCDKITITLHGPVYTSNRESSTSHLRATATDLSNAMQTHNNTVWWHLSNPGDIHSASFSNIHSRLYESAALASYFPSLPESALLNLDSEGEAVTHARAIAAGSDKRILEDAGKRWFWGDCRAEGLDLRSVGGLEVGEYDEEREPGVWREVLGVVDGRRERVDWLVVGGKEGRLGEEVSGSESESEGEGEGGNEEGNGKDGVEEEESDSDDVVEIEAPEKKRKKFEVMVPVRM
ncbi:MAG: hypothetical protein Q9209_001193 [Squamulea sp. 1 TL-2023]